MAQTNVLKYVIQPELADSFLRKHEAIEIRIRRLLGMEPDLVAYSARSNVLWVCEITASGFLGKGDGDFHIGASRKFCEGFAKLSIVSVKATEAAQEVAARCKNPQ